MRKSVERDKKNCSTGKAGHFLIWGEWSEWSTPNLAETGLSDRDTYAIASTNHWPSSITNLLQSSSRIPLGHPYLHLSYGIIKCAKQWVMWALYYISHLYYICITKLTSHQRTFFWTCCLQTELQSKSVLWTSFQKVAFPCRRKKAMFRRAIHMQLLGHGPASSHYRLLQWALLFWDTVFSFHCSFGYPGMSVWSHAEIATTV